jgi:trimeric autotransporter adhesin
VPNVFTPNSDMINDTLFVRGKGVKSLDFEIYDRWGEKVFESENLNIGWDGTFHGKPMDQGVFVWHLKAVLNTDKEINWKGTISLIR